ncbi:Phospholipase A-2-activating protein [Galdieria sulphuraria]|nr:Phospholipase A-2-activating protein [Galdieria sulphuraria]
MTNKVHFQLSAELVGHEKEVRAVLALSDQVLVTGSRDETLKVWKYVEEDKQWKLESSFQVHKGFISCLAALHTDQSRFPLVLSGGGDATIRATDIMTGSQVGIGEGHSNTVCDIQVGEATQFMISCSWDCTSIVWNWKEEEKGNDIVIRIFPLITLRGHKASVWSAIILSFGCFQTASADKTIKLWNERGECLETLYGHQDVVRCLYKVPNSERIVSVSNDGYAICWKALEQRHWEIEHRLFLSNHFLYSLTYLSALDCFVTGGEDGSVIIFSFEQGVAQTLSHPKTVWALTTLPGREDLVTCSDDAVLQSFHDKASTKKLSASMVQGVDWDKLPLYEQVIDTPGTREGELKVVRKGNEAQVLIWSEQQWSKFGDVVDNPQENSGQSGYLDGEYYDYIFDVDIGDDQPKRKLGYRKGENPLAAAQRFLLKEELPLEYIDQVADFIDRNTDYRQRNMDMEGDPLTGSSRYIPMGDNRDKNASIKDPFTENRYRPSSNNDTQSATAAQEQHFPSNEFIYFGHSDQFANMRKKLNEFNHQVNEDMRLSDEEWNLVSNKVIQQLEQESQIVHCIFSEEELQVMEKLLDWPTENIIPVLDIFRLMILSPSASSYFFLKKENFGLDKVRRHLLSSKATIGVVILACRVICNMFSTRLVALLACDQWELICPLFHPSVYVSHAKSIEAYSALLHNYGIQLSKGGEDFIVSTNQWMTCAMEWLELLHHKQVQDFSSIYAVWTALGTIFVSHPSLLQEAMEKYALLDIMERYMQSSEKIKECIKQIEYLIAQSGT